MYNLTYAKTPGTKLKQHKNENSQMKQFLTLKFKCSIFVN